MAILPATASAGIVIHRELHVEDGLIQSQVNAVHEAGDGHVWFGTFGGVSRWDGVRFENFELEDGLSGLDIRDFHETTAGDILICTADNGVTRYRDGVLTTISTDEGLPGVSTRGFHLGEDGRLYLATGGGLYSFADETLDPATGRTDLPDLRVSGIASRAAGGFYLSTFGDGVLIWENGAGRSLVPAEELPSGIIRAVHEQADGTLLVSVYRNGVWALRDGEIAPFEHHASFDGHDVMGFTPARDGSLYMPTVDGGVAVLRPDGITFLTTENGLTHDTSWAVHEGAGGAVYMGTWGGVSIYHPGRTLTLGVASGLPTEIVTATAEMPDGTMVVATIGGGISFHDGERIVRTLDTSDGLAHDRVWSLLVDRDGGLLIGTNAGLDRWFDGRLTSIYHEAGEPVGRIYAMHEARDGTLWLATYGGIRYLRDGVPVAIYDEADAGRSTVYAVDEAADGDLHFGTRKGLVTVRDGSVVLPPATSPLAEVSIWSIHCETDGTVHIGTDGRGLWTAPAGLRGDPELVILGTEGGLSDNTVFSIGEGLDGRHYLTSRRGVNIVDLENDPPTVRHLRASDGLAGEECNQGALFRDSRGRFWFGTIRGVTCYDPSRHRPVDLPPRLHWRRARLHGEDLPLAPFSRDTLFAHNDNFFRFDFVATNPQAPEKVVYRHRLSGVDRDWVEDRETSIQYTSLPPDDYAFSVMARNEWGVWSEPVALAFRIAPPFWKTWWFISLVVLAIGGAIALVVANRVRHLLAYEQLRTKIASDLHDDIGAGLAEISIVTRVLDSKLSGDQRADVGDELDHLGDTSRQLVRGMSDIVWLVNPQRDSLHDLLTRLADSYGSVFQKADIQFQVEGLDSLAAIRLGMERRQHLYLLLKEALNNALKYSGARRIGLAAEVRSGRIEVKLWDDGCGFDPTATNGNGLGNMKRRAEQLGGTFSIDSAPGRGTTIVFSQHPGGSARVP